MSQDDQLVTIDAAEKALGLGPYTSQIMVWPHRQATMFILAEPVQAGPGGVLFTRSGGWRKDRLDWVQSHRICMACGGREKLQVHHKKPFHLFPGLELDPKNLITFCEGSRGVNCHFAFGHGFDWTRYVPNPDGLAAAFYTAVTHLLPEKSADEILADLVAAVERLGATRIK